MLNLSQQEYVKKIDDMNKALCQAWDRDQKVKALKIAIQVCIKLQCSFPNYILHSRLESYWWIFQ